MNNSYQNIYKSGICGNIIEIIHPGEDSLTCCGDPMAKVYPNNGPEGNEKHIPILNVAGNSLEVVVGSVDHPMIAEHYIEWIEYATARKTYRQYLRPGDAPSAVFTLEDEQDYLISIYCNVHSLWDNLSGTENAETKRKLIFEK